MVKKKCRRNCFWEKGSLKVLDPDHETNSIAVFGKPNGNQGLTDFLFYKASDRQRGELKEQWKDVRNLMPKAMKQKPDVARGKQSAALYQRCICFGYRKDPKGSDIGEYAYQKHGKKDNESGDRGISDKFWQLSESLEGISNRFGKHLFEAKWMDDLRQRVLLPSFAGGKAKATQFSVGIRYWSVAHTDDDYYFTTLSCLSKNEADHDKVLYYFIFPSYKVAVPMKLGDIIFFNPLELHCCSNPSLPDAMIFSLYVSAKTFNARFASYAKST
ncbi:unnamed protein product [Cylindrotheca closterium]|uniref:Uncharacterized protein n=1 Tax=Cylindrotheca closterium TaxID=2856 RepID=A0AAD2G5E0_9STRA|nr:unnamed protein product [Cylindrotheca closterium]